jgi:hypothetical protein
VHKSLTVKLSTLHLKLIDLAAGAVLLLVAVLLSGDAGRMVVVLLFGGLWLGLAWKMRLSTLLVAFLLLMAVRAPVTEGLPVQWILAVAYGLAACVCSVCSRHRLSAGAAGGLWGGMCVLAPPLWVVTLLGLPRFARIYGEHSKWVVWPGLLFTALGVGLQVVRGTFLAGLNQLAEADLYVQFRDTWLELSLREQLWLILPVVGLFELAQRQMDDPLFNGRSLAVAGGVLALLLIPVGLGIPLCYWVALPVSAFMLTRWVLALPDWPCRAVLAAALLLSAWPWISGGPS